MKAFRTTFQLQKYPNPIDHNDRICSLGSCFAEEIGFRLDNRNFQTLINPSGIAFNPLSICNTLYASILKRPMSDQHLIHHNGLWHSMLHHGVFSNGSKSTLQKSIESSSLRFRDHFEKSSWLLITLGSAHAYILKDQKMVVANCHKMPSEWFDKTLLAIDEIVAPYRKLLTVLRQLNEGINIMFTVSPVRYWKDGAIENQRSKATLLLAVHQLISEFSYCSYFPAYELLLDDLRDYRFFRQDMVHPTEEAIDYVWTHFQASCMTQSAQDKCEKINRLNVSLGHRPIHKTSPAHSLFLQNIQKELTSLRHLYPQTDFSQQQIQLDGLLKDLGRN